MLLSLAILGLAWGAIHSFNAAMASARQAGMDTVQAQWSAERAGRAQAAAQLSAALSEALSQLDKQVHVTVEQAAQRQQAIQLTVERELQNDPRYTSSDCTLSDSMLAAINAARSQLPTPAPSAPVPSRPVPANGSGG